MLALREMPASVTTNGVPELAWTIGDVVRKLRDRRGWKQRDLAKAADLDITAISRMEKRSELSEQRTIYRVAKALEVTVADLYALAEPITLGATEREWLNLLTDLQEPKRQDAVNWARRLLDVQKAERAHDAASSANPSKTGTEDAS